MRSSSSTATAFGLLRAAMPPKTLDVIRHSAGARSTESPKGHRVFSRTIRSGVASTTLKPPSMACLRRTKQPAELLGAHPPDDLLGEAELLLHPPADVGADLGDRCLGGVGAVVGLDRLRELDHDGAQERLLAEPALWPRLVHRGQHAGAAPGWVEGGRRAAGHRQGDRHDHAGVGPHRRAHRGGQRLDDQQAAAGVGQQLDSSVVVSVRRRDPVAAGRRSRRRCRRPAARGARCVQARDTQTGPPVCRIALPTASETISSASAICSALPGTAWRSRYWPSSRRRSPTSSLRSRYQSTTTVCPRWQALNTG